LKRRKPNPAGSAKPAKEKINTGGKASKILMDGLA
jgi:hypothetical protein